MEINQQDFEAWLANPVTRAVRNYLRDCRERLKDDWAAGAFQNDPAGEVRHRIRAEVCGDLADLKFQAIQEFYTVEQFDDEQPADQD